LMQPFVLQSSINNKCRLSFQTALYTFQNKPFSRVINLEAVQALV